MIRKLERIEELKYQKQKLDYEGWKCPECGMLNDSDNECSSCGQFIADKGISYQRRFKRACRRGYEWGSEKEKT